MISTPATTCSTADQALRRSASSGIPNSGLSECRRLSTTGTAARAIGTPAAIRPTVASVVGISPVSTHQRGRMKTKYRAAPTTHRARCSAVAARRCIPLLDCCDPGCGHEVIVSAPRTGAEDRGFEPLRAINPTRVPGERHRPLGESSVGNRSRPDRLAVSPGYTVTQRGYYTRGGPRAASNL